MSNSLWTSISSQAITLTITITQFARMQKIRRMASANQTRKRPRATATRSWARPSNILKRAKSTLKTWTPSTSPNSTWATTIHCRHSRKENHLKTLPIWGNSLTIGHRIIRTFRIHLPWLNRISSKPALNRMLRPQQLSRISHLQYWEEASAPSIRTQDMRQGSSSWMPKSHKLRKPRAPQSRLSQRGSVFHQIKFKAKTWTWWTS